jgi:hypothetical protein
MPRFHNSNDIYKYIIMSICAVFLCDQNYFRKFLYTCNLLRTRGNYHGDICLVIGNDLKDHPILTCDFIRENRIIIQHFPDIIIPEDCLKVQYQLVRPAYWFPKRFQYHKFHLFNTFFKQWEYIFYIDCGITIFSDISPMIAVKKANTLLAHSDAYPTYEWKLHNQFDTTNTEYYPKLNAKYNMECDYCQTTIMLYDTQIIEDNTFDNLYKLMLEYPISITNDQGIFALYFTNICPRFEQIPTKNDDIHFYDYLSRDPSYRYIMLKSV